MITTRDFRPDAINLARVVNERARRKNGTKVVELDTDEFVHIHCGDVVFIVFRDVITAGSMYFESCLFGFFKEAYSQEITFAQDVTPDSLELYLNITHSWFFEIRFRGIRVVPADYFRSLIEAIQEEPFQKAHLEIPKLKLRELAKVVTLADRFLHRSLLCILRQMFLSLLDTTHVSWGKVKQEARDMDVLYHAEFVFDYTDTFKILSTGHDDEKYLRDALTESFYWLTLNMPDLTERFLYLMNDDFIAECDKDRRGHSETEQFTHAKGIFATDQFCYESVTRIQKQRRFKRVVNMCPFENQKDIFPWVENPQDRRIRVRRLHNSVRAIKRSTRDARNREHQVGSFVPSTASHQASTVDPYNQIPVNGNELSHGYVDIQGVGRGRGLSRGEYRLSRAGHHQRPISAVNFGHQLKTLRVDPKDNRVPQTDDVGLPSDMKHDLQLPVVTKPALLSNQATKWSSVGLNPEAQAFNRPSQMDSMISSIRATVSTGANDTLGYLEKQSKHVVHSQYAGQSQDSEGRSNQVTLPAQPSHSATTKTQKNHAHQSQSHQMVEKNHQGSIQKPKKYKKKKKSHQVSATAQNIGKPFPDIINSPFHKKHPTENIPRASKSGNANAGSPDIVREVKHGGASISAATEAFDPTAQLPNDAKRPGEREHHARENINGGKGRGGHHRKDHGPAREKARI